MRPFLAAAATLVLSASCSAPTPVTFQMDWTADAEFLGPWVAQEKGFFRDEGLTVTLVEGPAGTDVPGILASGQASVAQMGMTMFLEARSQDADLQAVMAVFQTSPRVLMTLANREVRSVKDLEGLKVGIKSPSWAALVRKVLVNGGADPDRIVQVPVKAVDIDRFYRGEVDVWTGFAHSEPVEARLAGFETNLIFPDDFGAGGYDELVVIRRSALAEDVAQRFVRAVARGWAWADAHESEVPALLERWDPSRTREFHRLAWQALRPLIVTGKNPIGWIEVARWPTVPEAFTNDLLVRP